MKLAPASPGWSPPPHWRWLPQWPFHASPPWPTFVCIFSSAVCWPLSAPQANLLPHIHSVPFLPALSKLLLSSSAISDAKGGGRTNQKVAGHCIFQFSVPFPAERVPPLADLTENTAKKVRQTLRAPHKDKWGKGKEGTDGELLQHSLSAVPMALAFPLAASSQPMAL